MQESATGIFGILNIREITVISSLKKHRKGFYLSDKSMKEDTQWSIDSAANIPIACVIGGVSFVGGTGKIGGVVLIEQKRD